MGLQDWIDAVRRHWLAVVLCVVLCAGAAVGLSRLATPTYQSSAALYFSLQYGDSANDLAQGSTFTQDQMASYATLATTPAVLQPVVDSLGLSGDADNLAGRVGATAPDGQVVLTVTVTDTSAERAAETAAEVADQLTRTVEQVASTDSEGEGRVKVSLVRPATVPEFQSSPNTRMNLALGLLLGLVLGALYVVGREVLDTRVRDGARAVAVTDAPLLGSIPMLRGSQRTDVAVISAPLSAQAETYRALATNVEFLRDRGGPIRLQISSSVPGEGKSTVAVNLALALAETDQRVLLVDADLRRPTIANKLDLEGAVGLSTVLVGRIGLADAVQEYGPHRLHVLTSGTVPPNPSQLLTSPALAALLEDVGDRYDVVVVDTAPILPVADALLISRHVTGTVLVAGGRTVRRNQLTETLRRMSTVEAVLLGVVVNQVAALEQPYGYGGYAPLDAEAPSRSGRVRRWVRSMVRPRRTSATPASSTSRQLGGAGVRSGAPPRPVATVTGPQRPAPRG